MLFQRVVELAEPELFFHVPFLQVVRDELFALEAGVRNVGDSGAFFQIIEVFLELVYDVDPSVCRPRFGGGAVCRARVYEEGGLARACEVPGLALQLFRVRVLFGRKGEIGLLRAGVFVFERFSVFLHHRAVV